MLDKTFRILPQDSLLSFCNCHIKIYWQKLLPFLCPLPFRVFEDIFFSIELEIILFTNEAESVYSYRVFVKEFFVFLACMLK